ncbi:hypothetical protein P7K49_034997 [Saguinus oedipus]|uniref:Uncharacterized protein n=1 Tax=Saguinus oedipus TaxID=9490 RepID=A0ABQ9TWA9_SAGOE|nr:hypothetical protein P7K49_034997 [Saguinus oedipus]
MAHPRPPEHQPYYPQQPLICSDKTKETLMNQENSPNCRHRYAMVGKELLAEEASETSLGQTVCPNSVDGKAPLATGDDDDDDDEVPDLVENFDEASKNEAN